MKPSIKEQYELAVDMRKEIREQLIKILSTLGVPDKERKIDFKLYDDSSLAAYVAYQELKELSKESKEYFRFTEVVMKLYGNIARSLKATNYIESLELKELKEQIKNQTFSSAYYENEFGFYIRGDSIVGFIFDDSLGSAKTKISSMLRAAASFEIFSLTPRGELKIDFNLPSKEVFLKYNLEAEFMDAYNAHKLPELHEAAIEYGLIDGSKIVEPRISSQGSFQGASDTEYASNTQHISDKGESANSALSKSNLF